MTTRLLRRLRGMCGLGAVLAAIWAPIGAGVFAISYLMRGWGVPPLEDFVLILLDGARNGFLGGFLFAGGLASPTAAERSPIFDAEPSVPLAQLPGCSFRQVPCCQKR
jgi:hypothetical protein